MLRFGSSGGRSVDPSGSVANVVEASQVALTSNISKELEENYLMEKKQDVDHLPTEEIRDHPKVII